MCHLLSSVPFVCTCVFCELHTVSLESEFLHFSMTEQRRCDPSPSLGHTRVTFRPLAPRSARAAHGVQHALAL